MSIITIVNYGLGNIFSVQNAIKKCGSNTIVTNNFKDIDYCLIFIESLIALVNYELYHKTLNLENNLTISGILLLLF